jgi:hypothetical protein
MPTFKAAKSDAEDVVDQLRQRGLRHLRARSRADLVTIESGPANNSVLHARLRRVSVHLWALEVANHAERFEPTPVRATLQRVIDTLVSEFGWILEPVN